MQTRGIDETTQTKTKSANNVVFVCLFVLRRAAQRELHLGLSARPLPLGCGPVHVPNHAGGMPFATTCAAHLASVRSPS